MFWEFFQAVSEELPRLLTWHVAALQSMMKGDAAHFYEKDDKAPAIAYASVLFVLSVPFFRFRFRRQRPRFKGR